MRYWGERDFEGAAKLVSRARKREPTRAELINLQALTARRLGRWDDFFLLREQGLQLDPLNYGGRQDLAFTLRNFGRYQDSYRQYVELLKNTPTPGPWLELDVEIARVLTAPNYGQWQNLMDQFLADGFPAESPRGQSWADTRVLEYLLLNDQRNAYWQERPVQGPDLTSDIYAMGRKYFEVEMLFFLGQSEEGMKEARAAYEAALEIERRIRDEGSWSPQGIELLALYKARLGSRLGESEQVAESLAHLQTGLDDPDHALRRATLYRYIEALATADTREAQRLYLGADPGVIMPHDFALRPHLFHSLLDEPLVRARFDDKPEWVQFMRDMWPASRPFPFDQDET